MNPMQSHLYELAARLPRALTMVDVGCRWGPDAFWLQLPGAQVIGFDPDEGECRRLTEEAGGNAVARFVPVALGAREGSARLHLTTQPACSSLFEPDASLIRARPALVVITAAGETEIELQTLDGWTAGEGLDRVDYLKLDTQGSELDILRGAERILASVRVVETEVEFNPIYLGQPLFSDVDRYLREQGFVLWRLAHLAHYGLPGGVSTFDSDDTHYFDAEHPVTVTGAGGQLYWADAFYVRREIAFPAGPMPWEAALTDVVLSGALGFWDLAHQSAAGASGAPPEIAELLWGLRQAAPGGEARRASKAQAPM
jgi:FkbM family methyltransferase